MFIDELFKRFEVEGVRYLLVGGMALNLHGLARLTLDIDLMLDLKTDNVARFLSLIQDLGYDAQTDVEDGDLHSSEKRGLIRSTQGGLAFTFHHPESGKQNIDILLENPIDFDAAFARLHPASLRGVTIHVASVEDLIFMRTQSKGPRHKEDIEELKNLPKSR